jgi:hypothetical protein
MEKREFNQEELAAPCLCAPSIPIYPSTTFAYAGFLPRVHRIETEAAIRAPGECKLSCVVPLSVCVYCLPLVVCYRKTVELIFSEAYRKIAHVVCEMEYDLIVTSM